MEITLNLFTKLPIRTKIAIIFTLLIAFISLFIVVYFPTKLAKLETQAIIQETEDIATMTSFNISAALVFKDSSGINDVLQSVRQNKNLDYFFVTDDSGKVIASYNLQSWHKEINQQDEYIAHISPDGNLYETVTPVLHEGKTIGQLFMGMSLKKLKDEVVKARMTTSLVSLVIFLIGMIAVFGISTIITKPLSLMVVTAKRIASGDLSQRASVSQQDEVGLLAKSFNQMVNNLEVEINRTLEKRVQDRTQELQQEITERIKAEDALRVSSQRQDLVLRTVPMAFYTTEPEGQMKTTWISGQVENVSGFTPEQFINDGTFWASRLHPEDRETTLKKYNATLQNNYASVEYRWQCADGKYHWFLDQAVLVRDELGHPKDVIGTWLDINERRQTEEDIRKLSRAVQQSPVSIIITNTKGDIEYVNPKFLEVTGYTLDEVIGKNPRILQSGETPRDAYKKLWETITAGGEWQGEFHNKKKDGELFWESATISGIKNSDGVITHFVAVKEDTTEKKKLEKQFLRSQRMESLGTLAGGIAHDLNNVLAPILMAIQLFQSRATDENSKRWLSTIESSAKRGADIVKQVLTFARGIEGERIVLQIKHLLREVDAIISETFPRNIQIRSYISKNLWTISGDTTQLHQVIMNLCVNARDAMPNGGALALRAENVTIDDEATHQYFEAIPGHYVVLSVEDNGMGIPEKIIDKIFDPFFTTKDIGKGTGLGLSTVMAIVKSHGGFVSVQSEMGKGSKFYIYLPASETATYQATASSDEDMPSGHGELILLVDDETPIREISKGILEAYGYRVLSAQDGSEAISIFETQKGKINLVITDMMMPIMDGAALIRALHVLNPSIKIIAVSGLADIENISEIDNTNVKAFITKPYKAEKLLRTIQTVLQE
jgi:two-component system cell cycle sensor histidine kinase/response regulator CckA